MAGAVPEGKKYGTAACGLSTVATGIVGRRERGTGGMGLLESMGLGVCPVHDVGTGEVKVESGNAVLVTAAIGSCVAVAALDGQRQVGGMAHVMLPGRAREGVEDSTRFRYAEDAIDELLIQLERAGVDRERLDICLAGGGNVLRRHDDTICKQNICSVLAALEQRNLPVRAQSLGGYQRRRLRVEVSRGQVYWGEGDGPEVLLWQVTPHSLLPTASDVVRHSPGSALQCSRDTECD